ncbi:hypothetical protein Kfla_1125 [Kribbella flavida DSM 17836]|uniref:Uncharacterized protein n=2 Tax=Kribbella flavida TaxID=182640 RepID=D2Q2P8_KRIFD|nr:hypothetical protein Kfla_1125 [Kribbella flavida DSM 17836]
MSAVAALSVAAVLPLSASAVRPGPTPPADAPAKATAATAAGVCNLSAPTRVAISRPYLELPIRISGNCTAAGSTSYWVLTHPSRGPVNEVGFEDTTTYPWDILSDDPIGVQKFVADGAWDPADQPLTQNSPTTTIKLAAGAWISSTRTADVVTLKGTSLLYSVSKNIFFKRSASGVFQYRDRGTTTWKNLKAVTTNSAGEATMAYRYTPLRDYRFALYSTSISWDLASATTTR